MTQGWGAKQGGRNVIEFCGEGGVGFTRVVRGRRGSSACIIRRAGPFPISATIYYTLVGPHHIITAATITPQRVVVVVVVVAIFMSVVEWRSR